LDAEEEAKAARALDSARAEEDERSAMHLEEELAHAESRARRARSEAEELMENSSELAIADTAAEVLEAAEEAEAQGDSLEEERARLQEELGTLRFSVKDMKSFQHRRVQELDSQVQRLEKQRRRLESEQAAQKRREEASEAAEAQETKNQLLRLQALNARLTAQVLEAQKERGVKEQQIEDLSSERDRLRQWGERETKEVAVYHERLDKLAESEGSLRRDASRLRNQAQLLQRQVSMLDDTTAQTTLQLEEAEAAHQRLREEEESSERHAEIVGWELRVAESHLSSSRQHRTRPRGARDSAASSDSAAPGGGGSGPRGAEAPP